MSNLKAQIEVNKERVRNRLTSENSRWSRECLLPYPGADLSHSDLQGATMPDGWIFDQRWVVIYSDQFSL